MAESIGAKLAVLFRACDKDGDGRVLLPDLAEVLLKWNLTLTEALQGQLGAMFGYDRSQLSLDDFQHVVLFLLQIFKAWKALDLGQTQVLKRSQIRSLVGSTLGPQLGSSVEKFESLFDGLDGGEAVRFEDYLSLMLFVLAIALHFALPATQRDNQRLLDAADIQAMLRVIGVALTSFEVGLVLKLRAPALDLGPAFDLDAFVDLLHSIKANKDKIRETAKKLREKQRSDDSALDSGGRRAANFLPRALHLTPPATLAQIRQRSAQDPGLRAALSAAQGTGRWADGDFPPTEASVYPRSPARNAVVTAWKRPSEISASASLFKDGASEGDVMQGALGNCWFLSALSVLAATGNTNLQNLFTAQYPDLGIYQVRFFKNGEWQLVTVDDRLPVNSSGQPAFARCRNPDEFWVPLVEKAYAKIHGSYESIEAGSIAEALVDLTGEVSQEIAVKPGPELWRQLERNEREGFLMGAGWIEHDVPANARTPFGIVKNHAYGILAVKERQGHRLVNLKNPWGEFEWNGRWADGAKEWTPDLIQAFGAHFGDDGNFWMSYEDFCVHFNQLYVLWLLSDDVGEVWTKKECPSMWNVQTAGGCVNFDSWPINPQWKVVSSRADNSVFVSVRHMDGRMIRPKPNLSYPSFGAFVMKLDSPEERYKKQKAVSADLVVMSTYTNARENSLEFEPEVGVGYAVIPSTFEPDTRLKFLLTIYSRYPVLVEELSGDKPTTVIKGAWSAALKTNGGSIDSPAWRFSPQYLLRIASDGKYRITLTQPVIEPLPPIGFTIFRSDPELRQKLQLKDFVLVPREFISTAVVAGEVSLQAGDYNLLVSTDRPTFANTFTLDVESANGQFTLSEMAPYKILSLPGSWTRAESGNHPTWMQNPYYALTLQSKQTLTVVVRYPDILKDVNLGFYVFAAGPNNSLGNALTKSKFTPVSAAETFRLDKGEYIVVPTTFTPHILREFFLDVFSDATDITIKRIDTKTIQM